MEKPRCCPAANNGAPTRENAPVRALAPTTQSGPPRVRGGSLDGMAKLEGAAFWMGTGDPNVYAADGEGPARLVTLTGFYISRHAVDNAHFARFCRESGYRTDAERLGWSFVFQGSLSDGNAGDPLPGAPWWRGRLLRVGRHAAPHRSRVGICGARRTRSQDLSLGRRTPARWTASLQHFPRRLSRPRHRRGRICRARAGGRVSAKRFRSLQYDRPTRGSGARISFIPRGIAAIPIRPIRLGRPPETPA